MNKLIESIRHASRRGYITRCVSNAYWATSLSAAKKVMTDVKAAGLAEINFSVGDNHLKFVPLDNVRNAVNAACEANLTTVVNIELFKHSKYKNNLERVFLNIKRSHPELLVNFGLWIDRENECSIKHDDKYSLMKSMRSRGCKSIISSLSVTPDERLLACCGLLVDDVPEMVLGDLKSKSLSGILNSRDEDLLKAWIFLEGPQAVIDAARSYDENITLEKAYVHPCQACRDLYRLNNKRAIAKACNDVAPKIYDRLLSITRFNRCFTDIERRAVRSL
jgi:hypothetical protein